jgi:uncharacterized protein YqgC (DUF456 family)
MDIVLLIFGLLFVLVGILGSFLPVLPGPPLSWLGLLMLYLTKSVPDNWWVLGITLFLTLLVTVLDYLVPAMGTKRFGGTKAGMWGTVIGLLVAIFVPIFGPFGIIIWPFIGALVGELLNKANQKTALKAAFGSFLGFLTGTFMKLVLTVGFAIFYVYLAIKHAGELFSFG